MNNIYLRPGNSQSLALSSAVASSAAIVDHRVMLRIVSSVDAWVRIATGTTTGAVVAQNVDIFMPAGRPEYFKCFAGDVVTAVPDSAATGTLNIVEMS